MKLRAKETITFNTFKGMKADVVKKGEVYIGIDEHHVLAHDFTIIDLGPCSVTDYFDILCYFEIHVAENKK